MATNATLPVRTGRALIGQLGDLIDGRLVGLLLRLDTEDAE